MSRSQIFYSCYFPSKLISKFRNQHFKWERIINCNDLSDGGEFSDRLPHCREQKLGANFFVLCPAPLGLAKALDVFELLIHRRFCLSPPWGFSNVLHCPRTLGETFKRKVEHFNTLQKVLAIAGGKCTPLKNGKTFILDISAKWLTHVWLLILPNNFFCWYIVHQIHQILIQQNFPHIHHYHTRIARFARFTIWLTLADSSHLWHFSNLFPAKFDGTY